MLSQRIAICLLACAAANSAAHAEGLQVSPVSLTIPERSGVVWLDNGSDRAMRAQVRVFRWHQDNGADELVETDNVIASPPFVEIAPEGRQVVRLVRFGDEAESGAACEQSYRILVDELPEETEGQQLGLQYVLRYSVPVYLTNPGCGQPQPELSWEIVTRGEAAHLHVVNMGQTRAQLADIHYISADGTRTQISGGLFGYVLSGAERDFALAQPAAEFASGGRIEVRVNGSQVSEPVAVAPQSS